jgi:hypothetical protein
VRYVMLVCDNESVGVSADSTELTSWVTEMDRRGGRLQGSRLRASDTRTVRVRDGGVLVTDGPFAETKEQIGGFDLLECKDVDEAIEVASKHPAARFGWVEVRPLWEE